MTEVALFVLISKTASRSDNCISNSVRYMHPYAMLNVVKYCINKTKWNCGTPNAELVFYFLQFVFIFRHYLPTANEVIKTTIFKTSAKLEFLASIFGLCEVNHIFSSKLCLSNITPRIIVDDTNDIVLSKNNNQNSGGLC